jgi:hypothetical protein
MTRINLNLDIEPDVLAAAERVAAAQQTTLPVMLERYLRVLSLAPLRPDEIPPATRAISGIAPPMSDAEVEAVLEQERQTKHGSR